MLECPHCRRRRVRPGTEFCPACGQSLLDPLAAPAAVASGRHPMERSRFIEHWGELQRVAWLFGLLLATSFVFGIGWRWTHSPWLEVIQAGVQAVIVVVAVLQRYPKLAFLFQPRPTGPREALAMVGIAVLFVVLGTAYFWLLGELGVPLLSSTDSFRRAGWPLWATFLLVSLMPAVFEELAFRGVIQSSLERVFGARDAWLIQAALFSVLHLSPLIFPSHFLMGLCFGYMRRRSRSIYPGMLLHACWNALVVIKEL